MEKRRKGIEREILIKGTCLDTLVKARETYQIVDRITTVAIAKVIFSYFEQSYFY